MLWNAMVCGVYERRICNVNYLPTFKKRGMWRFAALENRDPHPSELLVFGRCLGQQ